MVNMIGFGIGLALFASSIRASSSNAVKEKPVDQIENVIIFMQENRPFDHYFGKLKGVRGFNDRTTVPMRSGLNSFFQPIDQDDLDQYMLPFRAEANVTNAMCMPAPEMYYPTDIQMWNSGRMDAWNTARDPGMGMSYYTRDDLPYYYALYDRFVTGDHYYQSTFTSTNPNRMMFFSGSNGLSVGEEPVLENDEPRPGFNWTTMAEILEENGISWKLYQQADNFDDNGFAWFNSFQQARPGDALWNKGMKRYKSLIQEFRNDLEAGTLPSVTWIVAPTRKSEHATNHPCAGEDFTARILETLGEFPEYYSKSAFILNYDEGGQFYDHAWCPTPPLSTAEGISTVSTEGEVNTDVLTDVPAPIGMGFRVPLLIVSPWTRGNVVVSEVFDHTSVLQFLEERFRVHVPHISPWRRAMAGNLLSAFDFTSAPNNTFPADELPSTKGYVIEGDVQCHTLPAPVVPEIQSMPAQEAGTRISRALPYQFDVSDSIVHATAAGAEEGTGTLTVSVKNNGASGAPFVLYDVVNLASVKPRQYAVEAQKSIQDILAIPTSPSSSSGTRSYYSYALMGANGFVRLFSGDVTACGSASSSPSFSAFLKYQPSDDAVVVSMSNPASSTGDAVFAVVDNVYNQLQGETLRITIRPGQTVEKTIYTGPAGNWYDLTVTVVVETTTTTTTTTSTTSTTAGGDGGGSSCFERRFMGRMETGKDSISDPAMGQGEKGLWGSVEEGLHPRLPVRVRNIKRIESKFAEVDKDAKFFTQLIEP